MAQEVCTGSSVGSSIQANLSNPEDVRYYGHFYLNTAEPASCNGTISSVDYCYYGPSQYSNDNRIQNWAAVVALYHSMETDGSYRRVSDGMPLLKHTPSDPFSPNPETDVLLNFNCDTYVLNSSIHVQEGDIFGVLIITDRTQRILSLGQLDLVGDSSDGYIMMNKSLDRVGEIIDLFSEVIKNINTEGVDLPPTLDGLSLDTEKRVLHVYANISKSTNLVHACIQNYYLSINFTAPESDSSSVKEPVTENGTPDIIASSNDHEISTQPPISVGSSPPQGITIAAVLGVIVIISILLGISIVLTILYRRQSQVSTKSALNLQNTSLIIGKYQIK